MNQLPQLLGSLQFLGNPLGFVGGVASGIKGLFGKPVSAVTTGDVRCRCCAVLLLIVHCASCLLWSSIPWPVGI